MESSVDFQFGALYNVIGSTGKTGSLNVTEDLQRTLDSFDPKERRKALEQLRQLLRQGKIQPHAPTKSVNLHCHTFFSFNTYGYSPSRFAWLACEGGLAAAGIVDFDVLDGLDEFHDACKTLGLKG